MKKLLVLVLVLGLVAVSNAALTTSVKVGGVAVTEVNPLDLVTITIGTNTAAPGGTTGFKINASQAITGTATTLGGWMLAATGAVTTVGNGLQFSFSDGSIAFPPVNGDYLQITFTVPTAAAGKVDVSFLGSFLGATPEAFSLNVVPEPLTMGLLALGGLFIRRKK